MYDLTYAIYLEYTYIAYVAKANPAWKTLRRQIAGGYDKVKIRECIGQSRK